MTAPWIGPAPTFPSESTLKTEEPASFEDGVVRRAQAGDTQAFERLYESHVGSVYAVCLRMLADRTLAEDATQEAFARAWQKLPSFRRRSRFGTWLHRLAVNVVLARLRADKGWREGRADIAESDLMHEPAQRSRRALGIDLERAVAALPPRARAVLVLYDIHGYSHSEIASMLDISVGGCKAQLHRARQLLRSTWNENRTPEQT